MLLPDAKARLIIKTDNGFVVTNNVDMLPRVEVPAGVGIDPFIKIKIPKTTIHVGHNIESVVPFMESWFKGKES